MKTDTATRVNRAVAQIAATLRGWAPEGLLDSYETERHALGEREIMQTQAGRTALMAPGAEVTALRQLFAELLQRTENLRMGRRADGGCRRRSSARPAIRPDGYVAWAGADPDGLKAALTRWFSPG